MRSYEDIGIRGATADCVEERDAADEDELYNIPNNLESGDEIPHSYHTFN